MHTTTVSILLFSSLALSSASSIPGRAAPPSSLQARQDDPYGTPYGNSDPWDDEDPDGTGSTTWLPDDYISGDDSGSSSDPSSTVDDDSSAFTAAAADYTAYPTTGADYPQSTDDFIATMIDPDLSTGGLDDWSFTDAASATSLPFSDFVATTDAFDSFPTSTGAADSGFSTVPSSAEATSTSSPSSTGNSNSGSRSSATKAADSAAQSSSSAKASPTKKDVGSGASVGAKVSGLAVLGVAGVFVFLL